MKTNRFFWIDILLIPLFVALMYTGVKLHVADSHDSWHNWAVAHVLSGLLFSVIAIWHMKQHWGWYKSVFRRLGNKSRVTLALSLLFLFEFISGISLVAFVDGEGSSIGFWHFVLGLAMGLVVILHLCGRWKFLLNCLKR